MSRALRITRGRLLYLAAWLPLVTLFAVVMHAMGFVRGWAVSFQNAAIYLTPAILLGVPAMAAARRLVDRRVSSVVFLATHIALAIVYTSFWHGAFFGFIWLHGGTEAVRSIAGVSWPWQITYGAVIYGFLAGIASTSHSTRRLRERELAAARSDALRVRAEMQALRGQLDPHFLFNTLHSITALVRTDPPQAEEALVQFGALLRRVLNWNRERTDEVTLAEELSFVDGYLALEQLRLGDRLRIERTLSGDALECYVPVFSVQPLIENAIRHAIAPHRAGGTLSLTARVAGGSLTIVVADQGPGAEPTVVAQATGTGLNAIRQRLHLRHGAAGTLTVDTAPGSGFAATLKLPAVSEPVLNSVA